MRIGLLKPCLRGAFLGGKRATVEDRLQYARPDRRARQARTEQRVGAERLRVEPEVQGDVGELVGGRDADQGAGRMQIGFGGAHVRPLLDHLGRQADRQLVRQLEVGQRKLLAESLVGKAPGQGGQ